MTTATLTAPATTGNVLRDVPAAPTKVSAINGALGQLSFRGYSIDDLATRASYEETAYLLWEGELPTVAQLQSFRQRLAGYRALPPVLIEQLSLIPPTAHPLAVVRSAVSLLGHLDPESESMDPAATRRKAERLLAQVPTIVAAWSRLREDKHPIHPRPELNTAANFLWMLWGKEPDPLAVETMDVALTLHAEHDFAASTFVALVAAGTYTDLHSIIAGAFAALKGPRHGGANQDVIEMVEEIGSADRAEEWTRARLAKRAAVSSNERLDPKLRFPGFGHAVYKTLDPRAVHLRRLSQRLSADRGKDIGAIQETVRQLVESELHFYPNVDYYSAAAYYALGIPSDLYTSIFAMSRVAGLVAHTEEQLYGGGRLIRPTSEYVGPAAREWVPLSNR
jgi:citrate synthase